MFLVMILSCVIIAYSKSVYPNRFKSMWRSVYNSILLRQMIREESNIPKEYLLHQINFYILSGLALYGLLTVYNISFWGLHGFLLYLVCGALVATVYLVKAAGVYVSSFVIDGDFSLSEYRYIVFLLNRILSILILPLVALLIYSPLHLAKPFLIAIGALILLYYLYRIGKGLLNALRSGVGVFYIFFYICTLEILPVIITTKFILNLGS